MTRDQCLTRNLKLDKRDRYAIERAKTVATRPYESSLSMGIVSFGKLSARADQGKQ